MTNLAGVSPSSQSTGLRAGIHRLWRNGWGAQLVVLGCLISVLSLWASWGTNVTGGGYAFSEHSGSTVTITTVARTSVDGDNAFAWDIVDAWAFLAVLGLSVWSCSRIPPAEQTWQRFIPVLCAVVLSIGAAYSEWQLSIAAEAFGRGSSIVSEPGGGPLGMILGQIVALLGGLLFARHVTRAQAALPV